MSAVVGCLYLDLFISESQSLKDKRRVVKRLKERAQLKFKVAVAEVEGQDLWQRARIAFVAVSGDRKQVDSTLGSVADWAEHQTGFVVSNRELEWR